MSSHPATLLLAGVVAGVASAAATVAMLGDDDAGTAQGGVPSTQELTTLRRLVETVRDRQDELDRQLAGLQLDLLTGAPGADAGGGGPEPISASPAELAMLREQVAELSARLAGDTGSPFIIETVSEALEAIRDEEDRERDELWAARQAERNAERLEELTEELGLDSFQQGQLEQLMEDHDTRRDEIMDAARETGDFDGLRDAFTELRAGEEAAMALFLTPGQLQTLEELGGTRAVFGGGPGRGGPPGFGGGRGGRDG